MRAYVAGPYSNGNVAANVRKAVKAGIELIEAGHAPYIPHLSHYIELQSKQDYDVWMEVGLKWLMVSDAMIRLSGESSGADVEALFAKTHEIPIYCSVEDFLQSISF